MARTTRAAAAQQHIWPSEELGSKVTRLCTDCGMRYHKDGNYPKGGGKTCPSCGSTSTVPGPKTQDEKYPGLANIQATLAPLFNDRRMA